MTLHFVLSLAALALFVTVYALLVLAQGWRDDDHK